MMLLWWSLCIQFKIFLSLPKRRILFLLHENPLPAKMHPTPPLRTLFSSRYTIVTNPKICRCHKILIMNNKEKRDCLEGRRKKYLFFADISNQHHVMYILFMYIFCVARGGGGQKFAVIPRKKNFYAFPRF